MPRPSSKKIALALGLALLGATYFGAWSNVEVNFMFKGLVFLLPVQLGATVYFLYLYWTGRLPGTSRHQQRQIEKQRRPEL